MNYPALRHPAGIADPRPPTPDPVPHPIPLPIAAEIFTRDPEECARLRRLLVPHPAIDAARAPASLAAIGWATSRLLFCDLDAAEAGDAGVPHMLARLGERPTSLDLILLATEPRWAAAAFEVDALDFLVKPLTRERLGRTIRRLLRLDWAAGAAPPAAAHRVFVPFERGRRLVALDEICAIHAIGNYTQVRLPGGATEIVMRPLRRWEETLAPGSFLRIHRSTLANAARLRRVEMTPTGDGAYAEIDGLAEKLPVSRRCLTTVRAALRTPRPVEPLER